VKKNTLTIDILSTKDFAFVEKEIKNAKNTRTICICISVLYI